MDSQSGPDIDSPDRPTPPNDIDPDLSAFLTALGEEDPETIRAVSAYTDDLAAWAEATDQLGKGSDRLEERDDRTDKPIDRPAEPADRSTTAHTTQRAASGDSGGEDTSCEDSPVPETVPDDATVSTIDIEGTAYDYYQWREGETIRSETVKR